MLEELKKEVCEANALLFKYKLVTFTWGNVSGIDRERNYIVIKPSGIQYNKLKPEDMAVCDLYGNVIEGKFRPSSDFPTHLELYKEFQSVNGIVHTHSRNATSFAQAGKDIIAMGTTHSDYFYGNIPCSRQMTNEEILHNYEKNTGKVIIETFKQRKIDYKKIPAILVNDHGPFCWSETPKKAVEIAAVLEEIALMSLISLSIDPKSSQINNVLLEKHFCRKHGPNAYYGQTNHK